MMKGTGGKTKSCDNFCNLGQLADLADLLDEYIYLLQILHIKDKTNFKKDSQEKKLFVVEELETKMFVLVFSRNIRKKDGM